MISPCPSQPPKLDEYYLGEVDEEDEAETTRLGIESDKQGERNKEVRTCTLMNAMCFGGLDDFG